MSNPLLEIGVTHFIGIGGIGMSGIAEVMHNLGCTVRGSDLQDGANVQRLRDLGITVVVGHDTENVAGASVVVVSSAIDSNNPELQAAREQSLPVVRRAEMLAELMRLKSSIAIAGTHGKTTTTSLTAAVLDAAGMNPTVINGGVINAYGTNSRLGGGEWMVVEADESDGSFVHLPETVCVVTNIDAEHLDFFGSFDRLRDAFQRFIENIPFYGFAVLCTDDSEVAAMIERINDRRIVTYGLQDGADVRGENLRLESGTTLFDVVLSRRDAAPERISGIRLPMIGAHNVQNALAALAVAAEMGIDMAQASAGLAGFSGVRRRFEKTGEANGVTVIDDYGHHPVEIACVLQAARSACDGRVVAVVQPHRYTRLRDQFEAFCGCFGDADAVIVAPVYAAGESPIDGICSGRLIEGLRQAGHGEVAALADPDDLAEMVRARAGPGDIVVCLGAGTITRWANTLPAALATAGGGADGEAGNGKAA